MYKGYQIFEQRGLDPRQLLLNVTEPYRFEDGFFHCIFSEQVFEHVDDLPIVAAELSRLTRAGGIGIHCFPGSRMIEEGHLFMPLIHWLPKNAIRKLAIALLLILGYGPKPPWPGVDGRSYWCKVERYFKYMNQNTHYRDIEDICEVLSNSGFLPHYEVPGMNSSRKRWLPLHLRRNGFPRAQITLTVSKENKTN